MLLPGVINNVSGVNTRRIDCLQVWGQVRKSPDHAIRSQHDFYILNKGVHLITGKNISM